MGYFRTPGGSVAATTSTRRAAYSFGGTRGAGFTVPGSTSLAQRQRFKLTKQWTRMRFRVRLMVGLDDGATASAGLRIGNIYLGREVPGVPMTYAAAPELVSVGGGTTTYSGLTEFTSAWYTPTDTTLMQPRQSLLYTMVLTNPSASNANVASTFDQALIGMAANANDLNSSAFNNYGSSIAEVIAEYDFGDSLVRIGLFLGDSAMDTLIASGDIGWGQISGFPQGWAQRNNAIAVVNACPSARLVDWASGSQKYARFDAVTPSFIVTNLGPNDLLNDGVDGPTMVTRYTAHIAAIRAKWPGVPIYGCNVGPFQMAATDSHDIARVAFNRWLGGLPLDLTGAFDFDRVVRDPANVQNIAADLLASDLRHPNIRGYQRLADAITIGAV